MLIGAHPGREAHRPGSGSSTGSRRRTDVACQRVGEGLDLGAWILHAGGGDIGSEQGDVVRLRRATATVLAARTRTDELGLARVADRVERADDRRPPIGGERALPPPLARIERNDELVDPEAELSASARPRRR
jgi:hypothetical protein